MSNYYYNYFDWLRGIVDEESIERAQTLNKTEYTWHYILDRNRASAGLLLRQEYSEEYGVVLDDIQSGPASVFEVLVALAEDFARNANISESDAYYEILSNLGIDNDDISEDEIISRIHYWLSGEFNRFGTGTPFPLKKYIGDAAGLDLWSAMIIYINENYPIDENWIMN